MKDYRVMFNSSSLPSSESAVFLPMNVTKIADTFQNHRAKRCGFMRDGARQRRLAAAILCSMWAASIGTAAVAQHSLQCGAAYSVQRGDTLFKIAERAYGDGWQYKRLFAANRDVLPDEGSIEIGDRLMIPCLDGFGTAAHETAVSKELKRTPAETDERPLDPPSPPAETTEQVQIEPANLIERASRFAQRALLPGNAFVDRFALADDTIETSEDSIDEPVYPVAQRSPVTETPTDMSREKGTSVEYAALGHRELAPDSGATREPAAESLRLMTGLHLEPYAGADLPKGGMITDLVKRSVEAVAPQQNLQVTFVDNWSADLAELSFEGAFDVSFPWLKPDCSKAEHVDPKTQLLCERFYFSRPFIEVPVAYYVRAYDPIVDADDLSALSGKRLCRPRDHFTFDLDQNGLTGPIVSIEAPKSGLACFVKLLQGEVDVVTLERGDAEEQIRHLDIDRQVREIAHLASPLKLHAVVSKSNPRARHYLDLIDRGLDRVMMSGEWFEVVLAHNSRKP